MNSFIFINISSPHITRKSLSVWSAVALFGLKLFNTRESRTEMYLLKQNIWPDCCFHAETLLHNHQSAKIWHLKNHSKNMHYTVYTQCSNAIPETFLNNCSEILNMLLIQGKTCLNLNSIKWTVVPMTNMTFHRPVPAESPVATIEQVRRDKGKWVGLTRLNKQGKRTRGVKRKRREGEGNGVRGWTGVQSEVRVGVLGWFRPMVLHNQPAKSTSSTSARLINVWPCNSKWRRKWETHYYIFKCKSTTDK